MSTRVRGALSGVLMPAGVAVVLVVAAPVYLFTRAKRNAPVAEAAGD